MTKHYLRFEGVNLDNFINDTNVLSTIRGGSLLLLDAVEKVAKQPFAGVSLTPISTGASSGLFEFTVDGDTNAERVRDEVRAFLERDDYFGHATFVVDTRVASGDFTKDREILLAMNRWQQMQRPSVVVPAHNNDPAVVEACAHDLTRPATRKVHRVQNEPVSEASKCRFDFGRENKQRLYVEELEKLEDRSLEGLIKAINSDPEPFAGDLDVLTSDQDRGNLHHKMAVIHFDGNKFGRLACRACETENDFRDFDTAVKRFRRQFLAGLLSGMEKDAAWKTSGRSRRVEVLLWGGDEATLVVPAWKGWETAALLFEHILGARPI